ncbi:MAG: RNA polymerase sigma factor [Solirubrobacteraceae bacterium]
MPLTDLPQRPFPAEAQKLGASSTTTACREPHSTDPSERCRAEQGRQTDQHGRFNDHRLYQRLASEARRTYHRVHGSISDDRWDAAFNMSYWKLYQAELRSPGEILHPASWLATAVKNEIISDYRRTARQTQLDDQCITESLIGEEEALEKIERRHLLRDISFILNLLPTRQRRVWSARFVWDYDPREIQQNLGLSPKAYEKALQQASSFLLAKLQSARQGVCETPEMESLIRGYAIWGERHYSQERGALARAHLNHCAACRHTVWLIRHQQSPRPEAASRASTPKQSTATDHQQHRLVATSLARRRVHRVHRAQRVPA